jgi:hypothetical protein
VNTLPTPVRSRNNSTSATPAKTDSESILSDFTLDFFNNESSELANLSDSLGINLSLNLEPQGCPTTQSRLNRASEILQTSLRTSSLLNAKKIEDQISTTSDADKLKQELAESRSRIKDLETNYKALQVIYLFFFLYYIKLTLSLGCKSTSLE